MLVPVTDHYVQYRSQGRCRTNARRLIILALSHRVILPDSKVTLLRSPQLTSAPIRFRGLCTFALQLDSSHYCLAFAGPDMVRNMCVTLVGVCSGCADVIRLLGASG